jgi:hypothetical protein
MNQNGSKKFMFKPFITDLGTKIALYTVTDKYSILFGFCQA